MRTTARGRTGLWAAALTALLLMASLTPASANIERAATATDPTDVSIQISQSVWGGPDGCPECATRVVIGRGDSFPDNLAGAAAAGARAPLLLHPPAPAGMDQRVLDEVVRVLGPRDQFFPCEGLVEVLLLGGTAAISQAVEDSLAQRNYCVTRAGGASRIETAIEAAQFMLDDGQPPEAGPVTSIPRLYLATAGNPADSAAASARASADFAPILVTGSSALDDPVVQFLQRVTPQEVMLLGGESALGPAVEQRVRELVPSATVRRFAGVTRDDTARITATELWPSPQTITLVNGYSADFWVWALPGAVRAAIDRGPLLYVQPDSVPNTTADVIVSTCVQELRLLGPTSQVSDQTAADADALTVQASQEPQCGGSGGGSGGGGPTSRAIIDEVVFVDSGAGETVRTATLSQGQSILVSVETQSSVDPYIQVYAPDGSFVIDDDNSGGGTAAFLQFTPTQDGVYEFVLFDNDGVDSGDIHLQVASET